MESINQAVETKKLRRVKEADPPLFTPYLYIK